MNRIRFNQLRQKSIGLSGWVNVMLLLVVALVFCAIPTAALAEENTSEAKAAPCKGLKPYNNLDELLYQFYINLDSDCLFEMSTAELEKVWGIKILDEERAKPKNYYPLSETEFYNKPYNIEKDAFYIELIRNENNQDKFLIKTTKEYAEKFTSLFPDGKLPKLLPKPNGSIGAGQVMSSCEFPNLILQGRVAPKPYCAHPVWRNFNKIRKIELISSQQILITMGYSQDSSDIEKGFDQAVTTEQTTSNSDTIDVENLERQVAICRGLKSCNNLDELLYQFYINLDSDCLFNMPVAELEKIWNIKIVSNELEPDSKVDIDLRRKFKFYQKLYPYGKDIFYVEISQNSYTGLRIFTIRPIKEYYEKYGTLFPDGRHPKLLPEPRKIERNFIVLPSNDWGEIILPHVQKNAQLNMGTWIYYWVSSDLRSKITLGGDRGVFEITMIKRKTPDSTLVKPRNKTLRRK